MNTFMEEKMDNSIRLSQLIEDLELEKIYVSDNYKKVEIVSGEINRPGLQEVFFL